MLEKVLEAFGIAAQEAITSPIGQGLINTTWKVTTSEKQFIIQKINTQVFATPKSIALNIELIDGYLKETIPSYFFVSPLQTPEGKSLLAIDGEYYRAFPFIPGSHTITATGTAAQAYEAARQFGRFTKMLSQFDVNKLQLTIPSFHDLTLRYNQFEYAVKNGNPKRITSAKKLIQDLYAFAHIAKQYEAIKHNTFFKLRVTHHDTKISNVLFDEKNKGICVIDLDTIMPGYFISDVGDMMRTYLCAATEEETDLSTIEVRTDFYEAIKQGYKEEMKDELTADEHQSFYYAGEFMIYMQALRFATDYLQNDFYYGEKYPAHNFNRAMNQIILLKQYVKAFR
jgi:Ser/Thr protein kinase RdoA (MazF antagonist)